MKQCLCEFAYPNENMKHDNYWRCVDDYKCIRQLNGKQKTKCIPKWWENEYVGSNRRTRSEGKRGG